MARRNDRLMSRLSELEEKLDALLAIDRLGHEARERIAQGEYGTEHGEGEHPSTSRPGQRDFAVVCRKKAKSRKVSKQGKFSTLEKADEKATSLVARTRGGFARCDITRKPGPRKKAILVTSHGRF